MKRLAIICGLLLACAATPAPAAGEGVVVVRSSELAPYKAMEEAFLSSVGVPARTVTLNDLPAARAAARSAAVVLAIGQDAARVVQESSPAGAVYYGLITAPEKLPPGEQARVVPMFVSPERQIAALKTVLPGCKRVGVIHGAASGAQVELYEKAVKSNGGELVRQEVKDRSQVANALRALLGTIDLLVLLPDPVVIGVDTVKFLLSTSLESKVPLVGYSQVQARAGALLAVEVDYTEMGREAGGVVKRALAGSAPLPQPPSGSVYINGKTAQVLGVTLSGAVTAQSKEIF